MRTTSAKPNEHFGNPFSEAGYGDTRKVPSIATAVKTYKEWLLTGYAEWLNEDGEAEDFSGNIEQRKWILSQINQGKLDGATLLYAGKSEARGQGMHPTALAEVVEQMRSTQPQALSKGFKLSIDKKGKDQGKADLANRFIGYGVTGTSTYQYQQDAKKGGIPLNYEGVIDESTVAFVSVNGNNKASEKAIYETIENAREVLENGGTIVMDSTFDATRTWNQNGEALVQEGIGEPTGQTSKGYNYWGNNPEVAQPQAESADFLEETDRENLVSFDDVDADFDFYKAMVKSHPDVIFITNPAVTDIQTKFAKPETNQAKFAKLAGEMSITIPTDLRPGDNMKTFPAEKYNDYKAMVERKIADIKTAMQNQQVAFSKAGYGNAYSMPQELFVYLSKRLFEEFGYINPGSAMDNELNNQDIDDTEILESLGFESDPFKC
jgi:hypothetical protein